MRQWFYSPETTVSPAQIMKTIKFSVTHTHIMTNEYGETGVSLALSPVLTIPICGHKSLMETHIQIELLFPGVFVQIRAFFFCLFFLGQCNRVTNSWILLYDYFFMIWHVEGMRFSSAAHLTATMIEGLSAFWAHSHFECRYEIDETETFFLFFL